MKQLIQVTSDHIARGVRGQLELCPVALALSDRTGWTWEIYGEFAAYAPCVPPCVWESTMRMPREINLPGKVKRWVEDFDEGVRVAPMTFELDFPDDLMIREEPHSVEFSDAERR